ncbi:MAG: hypothetical protein K6C68_09465 [Ruminococcus sp.]|nr:hypothetical protein [Ruminococcus sp.]
MRTYLVDFENVKSKGLVGIDRLEEDDNVIIFYSENSDTISFEMHCLVMKAKANVEYMKVRVGGKNALDFQLSTLLGYIVAKGNNTHVFVISGDKGFDKLHDFWENTFPDSPECKVFRTVNISSALHYVKCNQKPAEQPEIRPDDISDIKFDIPDIKPDIKEEISAAPVDELPDIISANRSDIHDDISDIPHIISPDDIYTEVLSGKVVEIVPRASDDPISALVPDISGEERELLISLLRTTNAKIDLHNELMKKLNNERTTYIYTHIKGDFFKLREAYADSKPAKPEPEPETVPEKKPAKPETPAPTQQAQLKKVTPTEKKKLHTILDSVADGDEFSGVVAQFNCSATAQQLYINLMQRFGQERGRELYKLVKPEFLGFISDAAKPKKQPAGKQAKAAEPQKTEPAKAAPENKPEKAAPKKIAEPELSDGDKRLHELSDEIVADKEYDKLRTCVVENDSVHSLYLSLIKGFGKKRGTAVYNKIKKELAELRVLLGAEVNV